MENLNSIDLHRFSWVGKPYTNKKLPLNFIRASKNNNDIPNKTCWSVESKEIKKLWIKLINRSEFYIDTFLGTPCIKGGNFMSGKPQSSKNQAY